MTPPDNKCSGSVSSSVGAVTEPSPFRSCDCDCCRRAVLKIAEWEGAGMGALAAADAEIDALTELAEKRRDRAKYAEKERDEARARVAELEAEVKAWEHTAKFYDRMEAAVERVRSGHEDGAALCDLYAILDGRDQ